MNTYGPDKNVHLFCALGSLSHERFCCKAVPEHIKFKAWPSTEAEAFTPEMVAWEEEVNTLMLQEKCLSFC